MKITQQLKESLNKSWWNCALVVGRGCQASNHSDTQWYREDLQRSRLPKYKCTNHRGLVQRFLSKGFTLIELVVVMAVIALLLTLAVPRYFSAIDNSKINVQRHNINALRDSIDKFFGDNGRYPENLGELVSKRYLREIPADPLTEAADWVIVPPQDSTQGAVYDVKSAYKSDAPEADGPRRAERQQARDPGAPTANAPFEPEAPAAPVAPASSPTTAKALTAKS